MLPWRIMSRSEPRDQLAVVLTCAASDLETMAAFYVSVVGLEEERRWSDDAGAIAWIDLRDATLRLKLARAGAIDGWPTEPTRGVTLLLEVPDVDGRRRAIERRAPEAVLETRELGGAQACILHDPANNAVWLIHYPSESPERIGGLSPVDE
jgi:catechol 2,3-dioxygenase-like lactoylglutathione lyase family enzyme